MSTTKLYATNLLRKAVTEGRNYLVSKYLRLGGDPNFVDASGKSTLMAAACLPDDGSSYRIYIVENLLQYGADVNLKDNHGRTALHFAYNCPKVTASLINYGADVNLQDNYGRTALHFAYNNRNVVLTLINSGADVNVKMNGGYTLLSLQILFGSDGWLKLLICEKVNLYILLNGGSNVDLDVVTDSGSILEMACLYSSPETVRLLIEFGANPNIIVNGLSILDIVCSDSPPTKPPLSAELLGIKVSDGSIPIRTDEDRAEIIRVLIYAGANTESRNGDDLPPIMKLFARPNAYYIIKELMIGYTYTRSVYRTCLNVACAYGNYIVVRLLLKKKFHLYTIDENGARPMDLCQKYPAIVKLLRDHGVVKITEKYYPNWVDYITSVRDGRVDEVAKHLDNGANVDFISEDGYPMLHLAIMRKKDEVARLLVERGANVGEIEPSEANALYIAIDNDCQDWGLIEMLLKAGACPHEPKRNTAKNAYDLVRRKRHIYDYDILGN